MEIILKQLVQSLFYFYYYYFLITIMSKVSPCLFNGPNFQYYYIYIFQAVRRAINVLNVSVYLYIRPMSYFFLCNANILENATALGE